MDHDDDMKDSCRRKDDPLIKRNKKNLRAGKLILMRKVILLKISGIGVSPLLPVTPVTRIIGELNFFNPLDPLVPPRVFCNQLERVATFCRRVTLFILYAMRISRFMT